MAPWGEGGDEEGSRRRHDELVVTLITALSAVQEPSRTMLAALRGVLADPPPKISPGLSSLLEQLAESATLLGPVTAKAVRELLPLLGNGEGRVE
jgi:hypothetical protein